MSMKISVWDDSKFRQEIMKRYGQAQQARRLLEDRWIQNELAVFGTSYSQSNLSVSDFVDNIMNAGPTASMDPGDADINISYTFKNFRFLHAQLSANPPSVVMRPTSSDQEDHVRADAADRVVRYAIRQYKMQERVDKTTLETLLYGTGVMKIVWNSNLGDILKYDPETQEIELEGDIDVKIPFLWNVFLDPDARCADDLKWVIERIYMDYEEACQKWPEHKDELKQVLTQQGKTAVSQGNRNDSLLSEEKYNCVELLEYWENGLPTNQYMGRFGITTSLGAVLTPCGPSPSRFAKPGTIAALEKKDLPPEMMEAAMTKVPQMASLPYLILTDIDVPNSIYGKSCVEYGSNIQEQLSRLDTAVLDNIQAHGHARMVVPEGAITKPDDPSNGTWEVTEVTNSNEAPFFMETPTLMPEMTSTRQNYITGINDVMGVNESMFGQQSREQSGASMQYATNQGNMIRRRLFNKYVLFVESSYKLILNYVRKHWPVERNIRVLGKERAMESVSLKGVDIDGGYDVVGEYGVSLSLDPQSRREEIMALQPMFEKAGIPMRMSLKMMKLNELEGMYDKLELSESRQREYFKEMTAKQAFIEPEEFEDHPNMIAWAMDYFMTAEFKYMDQLSKTMCKEHIRKRIALAAQEQSGGLSGQPQAPGPAPAPGTPPAGPSGAGPEVAQAAEASPIVNG